MNESSLDADGVPAVMEILGRRAWYLPSWLDRRLPRVAIEAAD